MKHTVFRAAPVLFEKKNHIKKHRALKKKEKKQLFN